MEKHEWLNFDVNMKIELFNEEGQLKEERLIHNTVTTKGKEGIADNLLASPTMGKPTHMAIGTGAPTSTTLGSELDRNALTSKTRSGAVVTMIGDWGAADGTGIITEAGVFTQSSGGDMYLSSGFGAITKGGSDTLKITWTLTIT